MVKIPQVFIDFCYGPPIRVEDDPTALMAIRHDDSLHPDHIYPQEVGRQPALAQFATLTAPTRATFLRQAGNFTSNYTS